MARYFKFNDTDFDNEKDSFRLKYHNTVSKELYVEFNDGVIRDSWVELSLSDFEKKTGFVINEPEPPTQLDDIQSAQLISMEAMADQYEQKCQTDITMMDAIATIYEQLIGGTV